MRSIVRSGEEPKNAAAAERLGVTVAGSISSVSAADWDACALAQRDSGTNPFVSHAFLAALEESGSVAPRTGWAPQHLLLRAAGTGKLLGVVPLYLKAHSYGEYVFDQSWAVAAQRAGINYYPKLQARIIVGYCIYCGQNGPLRAEWPALQAAASRCCAAAHSAPRSHPRQACVPFTPVTGPRLMLHPEAPPGALQELAAALRQACEEARVSSCHVTFNEGAEGDALAREGFLARLGMQVQRAGRPPQPPAPSRRILPEPPHGPRSARLPQGQAGSTAVPAGAL